MWGRGQSARWELLLFDASKEHACLANVTGLFSSTPSDGPCQQENINLRQTRIVAKPKFRFLVGWVQPTNMLAYPGGLHPPYGIGLTADKRLGWQLD